VQRLEISGHVLERARDFAGQSELLFDRGIRPSHPLSELVRSFEVHRQLVLQVRHGASGSLFI
jgi:hypothetical protein